MWFTRKSKNRRFERDYVLDVKLRSSQVRAARVQSMHAQDIGAERSLCARQSEGQRWQRCVPEVAVGDERALALPSIDLDAWLDEGEERGQGTRGFGVEPDPHHLRCGKILSAGVAHLRLLRHYFRSGAVLGRVYGRGCAFYVSGFGREEYHVPAGSHDLVHCFRIHGPVAPGDGELVILTFLLTLRVRHSSVTPT